MSKCELLSGYVSGRMTLNDFMCACKANNINPYELLTNKDMKPEQFTLEQARDYVRRMGRKRMTFFYNVYGWSAYYTLQPTFATPTGKLRDFPRTKRISI